MIGLGAPWVGLGALWNFDEGKAKVACPFFAKIEACQPEDLNDFVRL